MQLCRLAIRFFQQHYVSKAPVTPGLRPGYDLHATEKCWNRGQIVERTYDWSQRSWVIARATSARSMVMFKTSNLRFGATIDRTIGRRSQRLIVRSVARCYNWSCDRSLPPTIDRTIYLRVPRLIVRYVTVCHE